jgi:hypothetical protein
MAKKDIVLWARVRKPPGRSTPVGLENRSTPRKPATTSSWSDWTGATAATAGPSDTGPRGFRSHKGCRSPEPPFRSANRGRSPPGSRCVRPRGSDYGWTLVWQWSRPSARLARRRVAPCPVGYIENSLRLEEIIGPYPSSWPTTARRKRERIANDSPFCVARVGRRFPGPNLGRRPKRLASTPS